MIFFITVPIALRSLIANKLRAGLTMLGIIIGVGAVIALVAAGAGTQAQVAARFESLGSNLLVISSGSMSYRGVSHGVSAQSLTNDDVEALVRLAHSVSAIAPEYSIQCTLIATMNSSSCTRPVGAYPQDWSVLSS